MKKQIRRGVFESNSSSTHAICMCTESEYDAWENGDMLLYDGWCGRYEGEKPITNHFYTREQAIEFEKHNERYKLSDAISDKEINEVLHDRGWYTCDEYFDDEYLESFAEFYTTPGGERIIAFGKYGYDS